MDLPNRPPSRQAPIEIRSLSPDEEEELARSAAVDDPFLVQTNNNDLDADLERIMQESRIKNWQATRPPTPPLEDIVAPKKGAMNYYEIEDEDVQIWVGLSSPPSSGRNPSQPWKRRKANRYDNAADIAPDDSSLAGPSRPPKIEPLKMLKNELTSWGLTVEDQGIMTRLGFLFQKDYFTETNYPPSQLLKEAHAFLAVSFGENNQRSKKKLNHIFKEAGYCCGQQHFFRGKTVECSESTAEKKCIVPIRENFFQVQTPQSIKNYCKRHFNKVKPLSRSDGSKKIEKTSGIEELEECDECGRYYHSYCRTAGLLRDRGCKCGEPTEQLMSPEELPETEESISLQCWLRKLPGSIIIRIFTSDELYERLEKGDDENSSVKRCRETISDFVGENSISLPYRRKLILAFGKPFGENLPYVTFFSMMVREYGAKCPQAKAGEISLEYVDSVKYFGKEERSQIYHAILNSYFKCSKERGFSVVKFWACPPPANEEYLFFGRPEDQLTPTEFNLVQFYKEMIKKGGETYSVKYGLLMSHQSTVLGVVINALENNGAMYRIISGGIKEYKKQLNKKSGKNTASSSTPNPEKLQECLQKIAAPLENVLFNLILRDNSVDEANEMPRTDVSNILQMAESSYSFKNVQCQEGMDFGSLGANIVSTSKLTEIILRDIKQPIE